MKKNNQENKRNKGPFKPSKVVHEKSCGVILFRRTEEGILYLLLHYPSGHWDFAKGHVEEIDENEMATAQRELDEETAITDIEFIPGYREEMYYEFNRGRKEQVKKVVVYFLAESNEGPEVEISFEHKGYAWKHYDEALEQLTFENARALLRKAEAHLK